MNKTSIKVNKTTFVIVILLFVSSNILAQSVAPNQTTAAKIDEYMNAAVKVNNFSGSILIARDGQTVISKGYGMANYELDVPNAPQTVFRLGSITKSFTATGVMMLQERGKLNVNDSICKYLNDCPTAWQPVTIRHLLTHTSGIPSYTELPDYNKMMMLPVTHAEMIGRFRDKPLEFAPGEKADYNNSGFYLAGVIIERVSGKTYEEFLQENIFTPLGMTNTGYDSHRRIIKNRAAGYAMPGGTRINSPYIDLTVPFAAGALVSTVEDLFKFDQALYGEKLLTRKSLDEMFTPFKNNYGYGWDNLMELGRRKIEKGGISNGFTANLSRFTDDRVTIIALGNNTNSHVRAATLDLAAIVFGAPYKIPQERRAIKVDRKTLEKYVGQYQPESGSVITVTLEGGKLMRQIGTQAKVELFAETETEFFMKASDALIKFVTDAEGRVTGQLVRRAGHEALAPKIK